MKPRWGVVVFAVIALTAPRPTQANFKNNIIFSGCAAAMRKEYEQANKQLLLSQLNKTCDCVVKQINNRKNIDQAKTSCINLEQPISGSKNRESL